MSTNITNTKMESAFIICPLGDQFSITRRNSDGLNAAVLKPILSEFFKTVHAPLDLARPGSITSQVINLLTSVDLVVANLTELNPNVMYELAVRHAANKPVILLAEIGTKLPFDLLTERSLFYSNDMAGVEDLKNGLRNAIQYTLESSDQDNPIYRALNQKLINEMTTGDDTSSMILRKLVELEKITSNLVNNNNLMNAPLFPERSIEDIVLTSKLKQQFGFLNQYKNFFNEERILTLSLIKDGKISMEEKNKFIETLLDSQWKFVSEVETKNKGKNEMIIKVQVKSHELSEFEKFLEQFGYKVFVKFPGLYNS